MTTSLISPVVGKPSTGIGEQQVRPPIPVPFWEPGSIRPALEHIPESVTLQSRCSSIYSSGEKALYVRTSCDSHTRKWSVRHPGSNQGCRSSRERVRATSWQRCDCVVPVRAFPDEAVL